MTIAVDLECKATKQTKVHSLQISKKHAKLPIMPACGDLSLQNVCTQIKLNILYGIPGRMFRKS